MILRISDWTIQTGARYKRQSLHSGEEYRVEIFEPLLEAVIENNEVLTVDLDGTVGYAMSWLDEVFKKAVLKFGDYRKHIKFKSDEEPYLVDDINEFIDEYLGYSDEL